MKVGADGRKTPIGDLPTIRPASADDGPSGDGDGDVARAHHNRR